MVSRLLQTVGKVHAFFKANPIRFIHIGILISAIYLASPYKSKCRIIDLRSRITNACQTLAVYGKIPKQKQRDTTARRLLGVLPLETRTQILKHLLCPDSEVPFENGKYDLYYHWNIYAPVLRVDLSTYLDGVSLLYGANAFKFSCARIFDQFVSQVNATNRNTELIPFVDIEIDLWGPETEWLQYFRNNEWQKNFPKLKRLDIDFPECCCLTGVRYSASELQEFEDIVTALRDNVKVEKVSFSGIWGEKGREVCEGLELAMQFPPLPESDEQKAQREHYALIRGPCDKWGFPIEVKEAEKETPFEVREAEEDDKEDCFW